MVDIGLRAAAGVLVSGFNVAPNNELGDGVNSNDVPLLDRFPFHAPPHAGFLHSQENGTNGQWHAYRPVEWTQASVAARMSFRPHDFLEELRLCENSFSSLF